MSVTTSLMSAAASSKGRGAETVRGVVAAVAVAG
jgi:hypothetical protein